MSHKTCFPKRTKTKFRHLIDRSTTPITIYLEVLEWGGDIIKYHENLPSCGVQNHTFRGNPIQ